MQLHSLLRLITVGLFVMVWLLVLPSVLRQPLSATLAGDAIGYSDPAKYLITKGMYTLDGNVPTYEREPGQSVFLAGLYLLFGIENRTAAFAGEAILYLLTSFLFIRELERWTSKRASTICFVILLALPPAFQLTFTLLRESLTLSLMLLLMTLLLRLLRSPSLGSALLVGALLTGMIFTTMAFVFLPLVLVPALLFYRIPARLTVPILLIPFLMVSFWSLRSYRGIGHVCLSGCYRPAAMWYVRGEQAEKLTDLEPLRCLWSEYISRDWTGRSEACSYNSLMHGKWKTPEQVVDHNANVVIAREGQRKVLAHFGGYLWDSLFEIFELHIPYVHSWGRIYNVLTALSSLVLYIGSFLAFSLWFRKPWNLFFVIMLYATFVFSLTDATPRYLVPVLFCYVTFAALGYDRLLARIRPLN